MVRANNYQSIVWHNQPQLHDLGNDTEIMGGEERWRPLIYIKIQVDTTGRLRLICQLSTFLLKMRGLWSKLRMVNVLIDYWLFQKFNSWPFILILWIYDKLLIVLKLKSVKLLKNNKFNYLTIILTNLDGSFTPKKKKNLKCNRPHLTKKKSH